MKRGDMVDELLEKAYQEFLKELKKVEEKFLENFRELLEGGKLDVHEK